MPSADSESPDESFFNDLTQQVPEPQGNRQSPADNSEGQKDDAANKQKRIACVLCRKRKLKCDGTRPTCGTCKRLSHDCSYVEIRKKSGPKRGYVKLLEARLQQVETLLKNQDSTDQNKEPSRPDPASAYVANTLQQGLPQPSDIAPINYSEGISPGQDIFQPSTSSNQNTNGDYPWDLIGLGGLDEPMPPPDVVNDLFQIYFTKIHPSTPIIHKPRFLAAMNLAPHMRPPICLRYIMWTIAASITDKYEALQEHFYLRARKYAQADEMKGHGEATISVAHCQAWILICTYEFKQMYFPRAWLSVGRAVRLAQMMQLHRLDGAGLDVKQCLAPPKDWTEREERRRTFWMSFCVDRYASIGTGWPVTFDERDILTNLPSSEEAFEKSRPTPSRSLEEALQPNGSSTIESFGGIVLTAALFGRNLLHLHRPGSDDRDDDLNGGFWTRHREIENILLSTALALPDSLRLPTGLPDPNVVFLNMSLHTSAICLHQAAIFKADKYRLPITVSNESKVRCVTAAAEIASVMRMISHMDLSAMNPFISFCVYVAARVFVQYLKTRPKDQQMNSSLQFLLQAMQALRRRNPLTESFLVQLDLDLEAAGIMSTEQFRFMGSDANRSSATKLTNSDAPKCTSIYEVSDSQSFDLTNTYGTMEARTQNSGVQFCDAPGPPFHRAKVTAVNLETQTGHPFLPQRTGNQMRIPPTERHKNAFVSAGFMPDENDMEVSTDDQPSPATSNSQSRGGSTSHTSHSPGYRNEMHNLQFRDSPKTMSNKMQQPNPTTTNPNSNFFSASDDMFASTLYSSGASMNGDNSFLMGNDWDLSGMGSGATGMTPMSENSWNQMLDGTMEGINLGWDSMGPPHVAPR